MVKKTILLLWLMVLLGSTYAQYERDTMEVGWSATWFSLNFDKPNPALIEFDPPVNNIWQIGKPNKAPFAPFTGDQAIMTDTTKLIDSTLEHSFILKFTRLPESNAVLEWFIQFKHVYQFDSLVSGGFISVSYDKGLHWTNVVNDDYLYSDSTGDIASLYRLYGVNDKLKNGIPGLTGNGKTNDEWPCFVDKYFECTYSDAAIVCNIWIKFTYINTEKNNPHAGWMIDDLDFYIETWCEFLGEPQVSAVNNYVNIYPNPASKTIRFQNPTSKNEQLNLEIFDIEGNLVLTRVNICCSTNEIDISALSNGFYVYKLYNQQHQFRGSFIINK
jgi:hypothetical protein